MSATAIRQKIVSDVRGWAPPFVGIRRWTRPDKAVRGWAWSFAVVRDLSASSTPRRLCALRNGGGFAGYFVGVRTASHVRPSPATVRFRRTDRQKSSTRSPRRSTPKPLPDRLASSSTTTKSDKFSTSWFGRMSPNPRKQSMSCRSSWERVNSKRSGLILCVGSRRANQHHRLVS